MMRSLRGKYYQKSSDDEAYERTRKLVGSAKKFAFISALLRYTADAEKTVIRRITETAIRINAQASMTQTNRYFPFTTSLFAIGNNAEKTKSFASLAD